jgi:hypothetical protein
MPKKLYSHYSCAVTRLSTRDIFRGQAISNGDTTSISIPTENLPEVPQIGEVLKVEAREILGRTPLKGRLVNAFPAMYGDFWFLIVQHI